MLNYRYHQSGGIFYLELKQTNMCDLLEICAKAEFSMKVKYVLYVP